MKSPIEQYGQPLPTLHKSQIAIVNDGFVCFCGNIAEHEGFHPCDKQGTPCEPLPDWPDLYRCDRCGIIVNGDGLVIVVPAPQIDGPPPRKYWASFSALDNCPITTWMEPLTLSDLGEHLEKKLAACEHFGYFSNANMERVPLDCVTINIWPDLGGISYEYSCELIDGVKTWKAHPHTMSDTPEDETLDHSTLEAGPNGEAIPTKGAE